MKKDKRLKKDFIIAAPAVNVIKGAAAGLVGGLAAAFVMNGFQALWNNLSGEEKQKSGEKQEPTTVKAAKMISENVIDHELTNSEKKYAGPAMHYAMGGTSGLIYGAASEFFPIAKIGAGIPFGAAVWLVADDLALPALGLAESPLEYPLSKHAYALASHFVYGAVTDIVSNKVREALH